MKTMDYLVKRIINYILSVLAMMAVYGIVTVGFFIRPGELFHSIAFSIMLFGYPFYRIIRSTVEVIIDYYENDELHEDVAKRLIPGFSFSKRKRIFRFNMFSKFIQLFIAGTMIYSFAMSDYKILKLSIAIICIIFTLVMFVLIKNPAMEYVKNRRKENRELIKRQIKSGFKLDSKKLKEFMKLPSAILGVNLFLAFCFILLIAINPIPKYLWIYYFLMVIKTIGGISILFLPASVIFFSIEQAHGRNYTIELGKGEYGQVKVEFYTFEGHGDDRKENRNKIDRVENFTLGKRYIYVLRMSQFRSLKIPRTFKGEELITEVFNIMT